ncbi:hypothetical protein FZEAL_4367 [Fusarium zealandicum]|uniref:Uncharacterized protein n=1 Tax=Fusarium zealandicum TaxID=1053134 RepID=A0A8H4ULU8_9HYPO|nr:hypothetical protein FZEAL_4367 [Fusarium zealandicum]
MPYERKGQGAQSAANYNGVIPSQSEAVKYHWKPERDKTHIKALPRCYADAPDWDLVTWDHNKSPNASKQPKKVAAFSVAGLNNTEKEIAVLLFGKDNIDWNCDVLPEAEENPLNKGPKLWVILKVFNHKNRFAKVVTLILQLSREQVLDFLEIYLREYHKWRTWEDNVALIPYNDILEHALERRISVSVLLHENRPPLHTDNIPQEDRDRGVEFCQSMRIDGLVEDFEEWCAGEGMDFLPLEIEWEIIQDCIDRQVIQEAIEKGWIQPDLIRKAEAANRSAVVVSPLQSDWKLLEAFLGTVKDRIPLPPASEDEDASELDTVAQNKTKLEQENNETASKTPPELAADSGLPAPPLPFMPGEIGQIPTPTQRAVLSEALQRTFPDAYNHVSGDSTSTLVEEGRPPMPFRKAYCPQGVYLHMRSPVFRDNASVFNEEVGDREEASKSAVAEGVPPKRGRGCPRGSRAGEPSSSKANGKIKIRNRPERMKIMLMESKAGQNPETSQDNDGQMPQNAVDPLSDPDWFEKAMNNLAEAMREQEEADSHDFYKRGPSPVEFNMFRTPSASTPPVAQQPIQTPSVSTLVEPRQPMPEHRKNPDTSLSGGLKKLPMPARKPANSQKKNQPVEDFYDEEEEDDFDLVLPEPEKDMPYTPKKKSQRKGESTKKTRGVGRPRKSGVAKDKEIENVPVAVQQPGGGDNEESRVGDIEPDTISSSETRITQVQDSTAPQEPSPQEGPAGNTATMGPPPPGRIKLVLKTSRPGSSPARPAASFVSLEDDAEASPSKNIEPLFGIARHQHLTGTRSRVQRAHYAWSAEEATFAAVSARARFAQTADRVVKPPSMGKTIAIDLALELEQLEAMKTAFDNIEGAQKAQAAQDAERAEFAGCADRATYALQAEQACFAVEVRGVGAGDGDVVMADAE